MPGPCMEVMKVSKNLRGYAPRFGIQVSLNHFILKLQSP